MLRNVFSTPRRHALLGVLVASAIYGCSGVDVISDPVTEFEAKNYSRFAWRSAPPQDSATSRDLSVKKSSAIRQGVEEGLSELGYQLVDKSDAEFLIEYVAATSFNEGQLIHGASNDSLYGSSVNREIDGASEDNAQRLSGDVRTSDIRIVFIDAASKDVLWRVAVSMVVEDANRVDKRGVKRAVREGLAPLTPR